MAQGRQTNPNERPTDPRSQGGGPDNEMEIRGQARSGTQAAADTQAGGDRTATQGRFDERQPKSGGERAARDHEDRSRRQQGPAGPAINMTATAMRTFSQLYDMQAATARVVMRAQSRAFSAIGWPDFSHWFEIDDDRSRRMFSATTDTLLQSSDHANRTAAEIQQHLGRLWEQQAMDLSETWRQGLQEWQTQASESLDELKEMVRQQADELAQATESLTESTRRTLREGGEQLRATMRQGADRSREITSQAAEATRRQGENLADAARRAGEDAPSEMARSEGERGGRNRVA